MAYKVFIVLSLLVALSRVNAVEFSAVDNTGDSAGGRVFREEVGGITYGREALSSATNFAWQVFQQENNPSERKPVQKLTLFIENGGNGNAVAIATSDAIHYYARFLEGSSGEAAERGFTGVIYHEVAHVWQWFGSGQAPTMVTEGIADFVRLKAGYVPDHWVKPGGGDRWDAGYDVTARFLEYCDSLKNGFVAELNKKMKDGYSESFFVELLGKDVNQLWTDYKAKYVQ